MNRFRVLLVVPIVLLLTGCYKSNYAFINEDQAYVSTDGGFLWMGNPDPKEEDLHKPCRILNRPFMKVDPPISNVSYNWLVTCGPYKKDK